MPYVWMDEVPRVQTVGANGMGVYPAVPVEEVEKVTGNVRSMKKNGKENAIPNPGTVTSGKVLKASSGKWASGTDADSLPSAASAIDGQVLTVASGEWTIADLPPESEVLVIGYDSDTGALDKTWQEIVDADFAVIKGSEDAPMYMVTGYTVTEGGEGEDDTYNIQATYVEEDGDVVNTAFTTTAADDYPVIVTT